jgi:hypothetical protein
MTFAELDGERGGFCDYTAKRTVIDDRHAPNAKVRVAIHELAHALGISSERFGRDRAEVIVESAAFVVAAGCVWRPMASRSPSQRRRSR